MKNKQLGYTLTEMFGLAGIIAIIALCIGWVLNVIKIIDLVGQNFDVVGVELIIRLIAAITFIFGGLAGYI